MERNQGTKVEKVDYLWQKDPLAIVDKKTWRIMKEVVCGWAWRGDEQHTWLGFVRHIPAALGHGTKKESGDDATAAC